ncbi:uncharacterized protein At3g49055 [Cornus florida]|uniref:uncharacterized protein At3g49055 n=1 Tax=Cornus florida TaxID=4283 RepID=UPI0028A0A841|nr:uncharacterized protein At3g49055 [Cornus florida]
MDTIETSSDNHIDSEDLPIGNHIFSDEDNHIDGEDFLIGNDKISDEDNYIDGEDLSIGNDEFSDDLRELQIKNDSLVAELEALRTSYHSLQSKTTVTDENLALLQQQKDEAVKHNVDLAKVIEEVSRERDTLRDELGGLEVSSREREDELVRKFDEQLREKEDVLNELGASRETIKELFDEKSELVRKFDDELREKEDVLIELGASRERTKELLDEKSEKVRVLLENLESLKSVKECLIRVIDSMDEDEVGVTIDEGEEMREESEVDEELRAFLVESKAVSKFASLVELKLIANQEMRKKEKRELENSVVSLTEENRDINSLLRIALVEKDAVEKSLNRLKGNSEQKKGAILQIAERGLQRVGFGFMMGAGTNETSLDNMGANTVGKSDGSEGEEEGVSLASTVERIMKNLRLEITQLRRSLEDSRSDTERLQSLTEKQAQIIAENTSYIKEMEDREIIVAQNIEELLMEIKETEEEVARWREACELEVEAGKNVIEERDKVAFILKQELEKTKAALEVSNGKLKLKDELAAAAMAAQAAAERSLQLADSRAAGLRERIEELTRQLEEAESRERSNRKVRYICWPWRAPKENPANDTNTRFQNVRRMLPEMQALLHSNV